MLAMNSKREASEGSETMTGTIGQRGKMEFATKLLPNCFCGVRYVVEIIGGPDRDRTDDLFHAME
jgi:hypothetical protein